MSSLLAIPALVFMLSVTTALGQNGAAQSNQARDPKPSDCLSEEKGIRPPRTPNNAAWRFFEVWDSLSATATAELSEVAYARVIQDQPPKLEPAGRQVLLKNQPYIEGLMRAAAMDECDWGVQHQYGEDLLLPHLPLLRASYRALRMDFDRYVEDGNAGAAADRLVAMIRLSNRTRTDHMYISTLVGGGISFATVNHTHELIKNGPINPATAKAVLTAFRSIQQDDLFGWKSAIEDDIARQSDWLRLACTGDTAGETYAQKTGYQPVYYLPLWPRGFLLGLNEQRLNADLDRFDNYLRTVVPMWTKPENDLKLRELEVEAAEGQFGLTASVRAWEFEQYRRGMAREQRRIRQTIHELEAYIQRAEKQGL
jgi:hypothetical protein